MSSAYRFVRGRNGRFLLILLALILFVILLTVRAARASTFVVNSTADAVDANPGDGVCAAAGEACTLRAAIQEANALSGPAVINLPAGTYALTIAGAGENASASGDLDVSGELTIVGAGSGVTTIDASAIADRIFQLNSSSLALAGVTLTGGNVTGDGGAFWLVEAALDLADVVISGNAASGLGGAIYAGSSEVTLIDSQVSGNSAAFTSGIRLVDAFANLTLQDTDVADDIQLQDGTLLLSGAVGGALDGVISGSAVIEKVGGGVYTLSQINSYSGDTRITAGTLRITHPLALGSSSEGTIVAAGATLDYDDQVVGVLYYTLEPLILNGDGVNGEGALRFSTGAAYSGPVILNSDSAIGVYSGAFTAVIDANISGPGSLTKVGPDLLLFRSVDKSYSGATTVQAGTLWIDASSDLPNATALTVNASAFLWLDNADVTAGSLAGGGTVYGSGSLTVGGDNASTLFDGKLGAFSSTFDLIKNGSGTLTLSNGSNAWGGATLINAGAVNLGATGLLSAGTAVTVNAPGTLLLNDLPQTAGALSGDGAIVIGPGGGLTAGDAGDHTFAGTISGNRLTKDGAGTLTLTNPGHTHADTAVAAGTLRLGVANALAATTGDVTIAGGAALDAQGFDQTLRNLSGAGDLLNAGILSLENSVDTAFSGDLTGLGFTDLTKSGPARLTLNGAVTADAVNLTAGDLAINGALTIPEGVLSAAPETTLRGAGTINAFTSVAGTLAPGASPGVLTLFELFLDAGAVYEVEIAGLTPGEGYDQVVVTASVELAGGAGLNMIGLDYTPLAGDEFVLIDNQGFGPVVGTFAGLPEGAQVSSDFLGSGQAATISYAGGDGNDVVVTVVGDIPQSSPFTVNTLDDVDDGRCGVNHCSLREAINAANAAPNAESPDQIEFAIAGSGVKTIQPTSALPAITAAVEIDSGGDPDGVVLDGALAGAGAHGLTIDGDGSRIQNLTITGFDGAGIVVVGGQGNTFRNNRIFANGGLGIDLGADGVTPPDFFDLDSGPNGLQNAPILQRAFVSGAETLLQGSLLQGYINSVVDSTFTLEFYANSACDPRFYGEGETPLDTATVTTDARGYATFLVTLPDALAEGTAVTALATRNATGDTSEFSRCTVVGPNNDTWPNAFPIGLAPAGEGVTGTAAQFLTAPGQARWFKFPVPPGSKVIVDLSNLPADYDLVLFRDIARTYDRLRNPADLDGLIELGAEFAPEMFTPEMFTPEMFTPEMFTPEMFAPEMFTPEMFTPALFTPEMFTPEMFTPEMFAPEMFTPEMFTPEMFTPEMFTPEMFTPEIFAPQMFTPDMVNQDQRYYAAALAQSAVAVSAFDGLATETVIANSWSEAGDFYVSVRGRNGAYNPTAPFRLDVTVLGAACNGLTYFDIAPDVSSVPAGGYETLILVDYGRISGDLAALQSKLGQLASHPAVNGAIVEVSDFPAAALNGAAVDPGAYPSAIDLANSEADALYQCVYAKNVVAYAIKEIVDAYRVQNPGLRYIVLVGNDDVIPFFRYPDLGLLANESNYIPPVDDLTASQASLRSGYVLAQDTYGAAVELARRNTGVVVPQLAVGRLVETPDEIGAVIDAFLATDGVLPAPQRALVTGYDFLDDVATAVAAELAAGLGAGGEVNTLVDAATVAPADGWTADQLRAALLENGRHDVVFLAGHFSAFSALAADYDTRVLASEIAASGVDMTNAIIFSNGCHSGYNIVNAHGVPRVTVEPDWAQAFARKGALLIGGTGYQYGDTDFIEYSERLYFEFSRELRRGSGPVAVGEALVRAKQIYLAETAEMRPIHEKALAISTLFGLPMLTIDMPGARYNPAPDPAIVGATTPFATNPGQTLGLSYADVTLSPALEQVVKPLTNLVDNTTTNTVYYRVAGSDRLVINPGEPVRPLALYNVNAPGTVLRGAGFRGGSYSDVADQIPLTGAAVTELRGIHTPFISDAFYPIAPWGVNYFDALANSAADGAINLGVTPVQYRSNSADAVDGTLRVYDELAFRLFYSANTQSYTNVDAGVTNTPALAGPPVITRILAASDGGQVSFAATVTGDPSAGIQAVWVTYTGLDAPFFGRWQSLDLTQDADDSRVWRGALDLQGMAPESLRYVAQAANGVGLVSLATNKGAYYQPDVDPGAPGGAPEDAEPPAPVELALLSPPAEGVYGTAVTFTAQLTSAGAPLAGETLQFGLTTQRQTAVTNADGVASVTLTLISEPVSPSDADAVRVAYAGRPGLAAGSASAPFEIKPIAARLTVRTTTPTFSADTQAADLKISLTDDTGRPLPHKGVLILVQESATGEVVFGEQVITDLYGDADLRAADLSGSSYTVNAYFASVVVVDGVTIDATTARYLPAQAPAPGDPPLLLIRNTPPVADAGGPYAVDEGASVVLDAGASSDVDAGQGLRYAWDLDDDGIFESAGVTVTFSAVAAGLYPVAVQVCDPVDDCDTDGTTVDVLPAAPPDISIALPLAVYEGQPATFTATLAANGNPEPFDITWRFGDGVTASGTLTPGHVYAAPGVYTVTVTAVSANGATATATTQVAALYGFMQACVYAANPNGTLTLEQNSRVDCLARAEGGLLLGRNVVVGGPLYVLGTEATVGQTAVVASDLFAAGRVTLERNAAVRGDVGAGGDVRLRRDARVDGDVRTAGRVVLADGATVGGAIFEYDAPLEFPPTSALNLSLSAGGPAVNVGRNAVRNLTPGRYGALTVQNNATLNLSSGRYRFNAWQIGRDVRINFDVSGGSIIIDVVGGLQFDRNLLMQVAGGGAEQILFRSTGDRFSVGRDGQLLGTYLALTADADLQRNTLLNGALYARKFKAEQGVQITDERALPAIIYLMLEEGASGE